MKIFLTFMMIFALSGIGAFAQKPMPGNGEWEKWRMTPPGRLTYYHAEISYRDLKLSDGKLSLGEEGTMTTNCRVIYSDDGSIYLANIFGDLGAEYYTSCWMKGYVDETNTLILDAGTCCGSWEYGEVRTEIYKYDISDSDNVKIDPTTPIQIQLDSNGEASALITSENTAIGILSYTPHGGLSDSYGNKVITELKLCFNAAATEPSSPPAGLTEEQWQIQFDNYLHYNETDKIGISLSLVRDGENVYITGFNGPTPGAVEWYKGKLTSDRLEIFSKNSGERDDFNYVMPFTWEKETLFTVNRWRDIYDLTDIDDSMVFNYDVANDKYEAKDIGFTIWTYRTPTQFTVEDYYPWDGYFLSPTISKVTTTAQKPKAPKVSLKYSKFTIASDVFDVNGDVIPIDQLAFRAYLDEEPLELWKDTNNIWRDTYEVPFLGGSQSGNGIFTRQSYWFTMDYEELEKLAHSNSVLRVDVVNYTDDGPITNSTEYRISGTNGIEEVISEKETTRVFDLNGREVNPERLAPGIYIKNGKKFILR